jgi:ubiquinone/menaquinone biosynthesis C-methylase UbiE
MFGKFSGGFVGLAVIAGVLLSQKDVLKGLDSNHEHSALEVQGIVTGFCLSPAIGAMMDADKEVARAANSTGGEFNVVDHGDIENDEYVQGSIYAVLYAMYKNTVLSWKGTDYMFTFNTWGIAPNAENDPEKIAKSYPVDDPQRHGKAAYAGLATQPPALAYKAKLGDEPLRIVEIGCGTGAGANLITREVHPTAKYLALDMQQAAINTCKSRHATADNPGLTCQVVPNGVGNISPDGEQNPVPGVADASVDFVIISETHIADIVIGDLEKAIFKEIIRVLKPGGLFLWGNALPTRVWDEAAAYLPTAGFELAHSKNWTSAAILARDEDKERVDSALAGLISPYYVMKVPYFGPRCYHVTERLIANFYRHPGTALYLKMVTGYDSYMHQAWRKQ